jgi:hypothetical protein
MCANCRRDDIVFVRIGGRYVIVDKVTNNDMEFVFITIYRLCVNIKGVHKG